MAVETAERTTPPDVRGPTARLPLAVLLAGFASIALVILGTVGTQVVAALAGGPLTTQCRAAGLEHFVPSPNPALPGKGAPGAEGICHIITAARAFPETAILVATLALGAAALAAGLAVYRRMDTRRRRRHAVTGAILGAQGVLLAGFVLWFRSGEGMVRFARNFFDLSIVMHDPWLPAFLNGAKNTILLALAGEAGGIVLGLVLAVLSLSENPAVRAPARVYVNFFRGTPLIWQLGFAYLGVFPALGLSKISGFVVAITVFSLNTGAYASEVFRAGIQSIERGQLEASRGLGLSYLQSLRYVVVPQAIRRVIPPLMNEFVILIKDTALITIIGVLQSERDLFSVAQDGYSATFNASFFVATAIGYLVVTLPLIRLVTAVERRLRSGLVGIAGGFGTG
jgi:His/Glu/Gln/Arg/opine family amino acid ABC transporter permease subunit